MEYHLHMNTKVIVKNPMWRTLSVDQVDYISN